MLVQGIEDLYDNLRPTVRALRDNDCIKMVKKQNVIQFYLPAF